MLLFLFARHAVIKLRNAGRYLGLVGGTCEKNSGGGDSALKCRVLAEVSRREL